MDGLTSLRASIPCFSLPVVCSRPTGPRHRPLTRSGKARDFIEKPEHRSPPADDSERARPRPAARRKPVAQAGRRGPAPDDRREPGLSQVMAAIGRARSTNATVSIHRAKRRRQGARGADHPPQQRAAANASSRSTARRFRELIESELRRHERLLHRRDEKQVGKFEQADKGTIFLDEIGDMSPKTQAKVLRVLQRAKVERLGSARTIKSMSASSPRPTRTSKKKSRRATSATTCNFRLAVIRSTSRRCVNAR